MLAKLFNGLWNKKESENEVLVPDDLLKPKFEVPEFKLDISQFKLDIPEFNHTFFDVDFSKKLELSPEEFRGGCIIQYTVTDEPLYNKDLMKHRFYQPEPKEEYEQPGEQGFILKKY